MKIPLHELKFSYSRSSGPGGQNVNKVNSKCTVHWNVGDTFVLDALARERFYSKFAQHINSLDQVVVSSDQYRDQKRNQQYCIDRLEQMVAEARFVPKKRKKTKPTKAAKKKRLESKRAHSDKKSARKKNWD